MATATITFETETDEGEEVIYHIPAKYEVCNMCDGHGSHSNPAIDGNGITSEEWNGPDWSEEERETYMSGGYDIQCEECGGKRVELVPDWDDPTGPRV